MRKLASLLCCIIGCSASGDDAGEHVALVEQHFESAEARLVDFEFDGRLVADTGELGALGALVRAQLLYAVGQLNGERSVGWYERLEVSGVTTSPSPSGQYEVRYHAKLPVAWGTALAPATYTLVLPASVAPADQIRFTQKYASSCVDPEGGDLNASDRPDAGRMFLFYRPQRAGCALAPEDVATMTAKVTRSPGNTTGKYPEYHRIWEDGSLDVLTIFGIENDDTPQDAGAKAFEDFVTRTTSLLSSLQPDEAKRTVSRTVVDGHRRARIETMLADGRVVHVDATLIGRELAKESASFDDWYNQSSETADVILYSGHAAHGASVRALMAKGVFQLRKYLVWIVNGCDTLAYVDRTLAERRATLNADDASGTKYMDTVSNVLGAWFRTGDETATSFLRDIVAAGGPKPAPKTYRQIFSGIDRDQLIVVTGEEDNEFSITPKPEIVRTPPADSSVNASPDRGPGANGVPPRREDPGCAIGRASRVHDGAFALFLGAFLAVRRARRSGIGCASESARWVDVSCPGFVDTSNINAGAHRPGRSRYASKPASPNSVKAPSIP